ncbi:hypothetical protein PBCV1_a466L [Paramecium bursaria Chlorella virus 1]|uniref:Uncharacterized protein n=1 Tax=Paramecium bursaria Chlorella virus 1 TaxID=10506 RepID=Q98516_PBCV1|nr:hypothetical protein PBCV1_a466L [Paramecium bursaria Chlorella virus 1]AAC96833.1 hypothetical protein [Paramecium bursaria Chlorella virus 1]
MIWCAYHFKEHVLIDYDFYLFARARYCFFQYSGSSRGGFPVFMLTRECAFTVHANSVSLDCKSFAPNFVISSIFVKPLQQPVQGKMNGKLL